MLYTTKLDTKLTSLFLVQGDPGIDPYTQTLSEILKLTQNRLGNSRGFIKVVDWLLLRYASHEN